MPHHGRKSGQEIKQGRNLDAGVETNHGGTCFWAVPYSLLSPLSYSTQDHTKVGTAHSELGPTYHISHQSRMGTTGLPIGSLKEVLSQPRFTFAK